MLRCLFLSLLASISQYTPATENVISYSPGVPDSRLTIIDTRSSHACQQATLDNARCLPAHGFLGPHKRLVNFSGLLWLLGSIGLSGEEHVLVAGDSSSNKEFVAGLLYLAGQKRITVLAHSLSQQTEHTLVKGRTRSKTREVVFQAPMRSGAVVLQADLNRMIQSNSPPQVLDGRSESEYLGQETRAQRGGHIPGAERLPMAEPQVDTNSEPAIFQPAELQAVAYGYDAYEGLVYLVRLLANGIHARIYLEGWAGWASNGQLHADLVTYPSRTSPGRATPAISTQVSEPRTLKMLFLPVAGATLFALGYLFRYLRYRE